MPLTKLPALLDYSGEPNGTGVIPTLCYVKDKDVAMEIVKHPAYRRDYSAGTRFEDDFVEREVMFVNSLDEFLGWKGKLGHEMIKRAALAKLTPKEIDVLKEIGI